MPIVKKILVLRVRLFSYAAASCGITGRLGRITRGGN